MTDFDYRAARDLVFGSRLPGALKLLLLALVEHMPHCRPSVATLALRCGVERKTVLRGLRSLEWARVITVERSPGGRSRYGLRPVADWRAEYQPGPTGPTSGPVPTSGTGTESPPVPGKDGTGTKDGMGPVPNPDGTGPTVGPKAERSRSEKREGADARARVLAATGFGSPQRPVPPDRALTMPQKEPTVSYLQECTIAGVSPEQARSTWAHYWTQGLPPGGVEKLEPWLVKSAKEKQDGKARVPSGHSDPEVSFVDFDPRYLDAAHRAFCSKHGLDAERLARAWRKAAVDSGKRYSRAEAERAFAGFLKQQARQTGMKGVGA